MEAIVKSASTLTVVTIVLAFMSLWVVMAAGMTAVWLTEEMRVIGLVILPTAIVAGLLVAYFEWRAKLVDTIRHESHEH